jgi:hypothetical protein
VACGVASAACSTTNDCCAGNACSTVGGAGLCCPTGYAHCTAGATACEDVRSNPNRCGPSCRTCPAASHANASCNNGVCGLQCHAGWGDCDANPANGCETPLNTTTNCGRCANAGGMCPGVANGTPTCTGTPARCSAVCNQGYTLCNGRCVNLQTNTDHCGSCGHVCPVGQSCGNGVCSGGSNPRQCIQPAYGTRGVNCEPGQCCQFLNIDGSYGPVFECRELPPGMGTARGFCGSMF